MSEIRQRLKVFIVDDSTLMRERLTELLGTVATIEVAGTASTAAMAIASIRAGRVDAVILDIDLNGESGLDVLKAVKQGPGAPVVIMLSIHSTAELGVHCRAAGADYYFEKGGSYDGIIGVLERLGEQHARAAS
ncbi:MAG: response regulator [Opitutaceae bacterium]|nr:response regulator [Opitutaceae bacterium]